MTDRRRVAVCAFVITAITLFLAAEPAHTTPPRTPQPVMTRPAPMLPPPVYTIVRTP